MPLGTVIDEVLTILPERCAFIVGATARQQSHVPRTLTANARSHSSTVSSSNGFLTICVK